MFKTFLSLKATSVLSKIFAHKGIQIPVLAGINHGMSQQNSSIKSYLDFTGSLEESNETTQKKLDKEMEHAVKDSIEEITKKDEAQLKEQDSSTMGLKLAREMGEDEAEFKREISEKQEKGGSKPSKKG